jgi:radical SAM protein with 4Fe4S-binding SPASM domain
VAIKLSLDGPEEVNDLLRGVPGAFKKTLETYEKLRPLLDKYRNFELGINTVFCSANQGRMDELIAFVRGLEGIGTHTVSLVRGEVAEEGLKEIDLDAYRRTIEKLETNLKGSPGGRYRFRGARLKAAQDILQRRLIHDTAAMNKRLIPCYAGRLTLVLTESGDLYPCESFTARMGNVREWGYNVKELLSGSDAQAALRTVQQSGCHCTHECYMMMNILFNPALYPSLVGEYRKL